MGIKWTILFLCVASCCFSFSIDPAPVAKRYTPNSILKSESKGQLRYAGDRPRYSTCSAVAWLRDDNYLAAVNVATSSIQIYQFSKERGDLVPLRQYRNTKNLNLSRPDDISFSPDGRFAAVANLKQGTVNLYRHRMRSDFSGSVLKRLSTLELYFPHGTTFSSGGEYFFVAAMGSSTVEGKLLTYRINGENLTLTQDLKNPYEPLKPKSIAITPNHKFVVIGCCTQLSKHRKEHMGVLVCHKFDAERGEIDPNPISIVEGLVSTECVVISPDSKTVLSVDQANDLIVAHEFDPSTGIFGENFVALENPQAELSFPHGIALSKDGRFLAVANIGDDKVTLYRVKEDG